MSSHKSLMPGTKFPSVTVDSIAGSKIALDAPTAGMNRLVVVYRGQFCPFCQGEEFEIHKGLALLRHVPQSQRLLRYTAKKLAQNATSSTHHHSSPYMHVSPHPQAP
jgi:peroxiredoxin